MKELYFLCDWLSDKTRTWSGTCWGLYQALSKKINIRDVNTNTRMSIFFKVFNRLGILKSDMGYLYILRMRKKLLPAISQNCDANVFQFVEYIPAIGNIKSYIYKDLTVSYIKYMSENLPSIFKYSGFGVFTSKDLEKRLILEKENLNTCTAIFCMGEWLRQDCVDRMGISSNIVYAVGGGINLNISKIRTIQKDSNKILFVGRDFYRKGGYLVYDAFCELKKVMPKAELYVAGPQTDPIVAPLDGYHYLGDCDHDTLSGYFNQCDIFCMPSYFEAYGLVFIEALTYGLPCIGRRCYEMPYFIQEGETGLLVEDDNEKELADKMYRLLNDEYIKANVLAKREWYISQYSWDAVAERIYKVISLEYMEITAADDDQD